MYAAETKGPKSTVRNYWWCQCCRFRLLPAFTDTQNIKSIYIYVQLTTGGATVLFHAAASSKVSSDQTQDSNVILWALQFFWRFSLAGTEHPQQVSSTLTLHSVADHGDVIVRGVISYSMWPGLDLCQQTSWPLIKLLFSQRSHFIWSLQLRAH